MVVLKNIKSDFYKEYGFTTKEKALRFIKDQGMTGRDFETIDDLKKFLSKKEKPKKLEDLYNSMSKDERKQMKELVKANKRKRSK